MDVADINGAGKLLQKEENDDTGTGLNIVRKGKIRVKKLSRRIWLISGRILANISNSKQPHVLSQKMSFKRIPVL